MKKELLSLLLIYLCACGQESGPLETKPSIQDITESVYASVEVLPRESYFAQSLASGIIDSIAVTEGNEIQKGELICKIRANMAKTRLKDAKIGLAKTRDDMLGENSLLKNLKLEIETARQQQAWDSVQYFRLKKLWEQKIGSENMLEQAKVKYESSQNHLQLLNKKYKQSQSDLERAYDSAVNRLEGEKISLKDFTVRALMDGRIYEVFKEEGELISPQERLAEIGSMDSFKIEMDVDEVDIARITTGDTALVSLDAYPGKVFPAIVQSILPKKNKQNLTYAVRARFIKAPNLLYGLSGEANIIVDRRKDALTLPPEYVQNNKSVITNEGEKEVTLGVKTLEFVEIVAGIDSSTIVFKPES